jgi:hypothetical protein
MNIMAFPGQEILKIMEDGIEKTYLVLTVDQLFIVREQEPHRLRKIDNEWCVRVEHIH